MAKGEREALVALPLLQFAFRELVAKRGEVQIVARLTRFLERPTPPAKDAAVEELLRRASERVLKAIQIDFEAPAWVYVWNSNTGGAPLVSTRVAPWEVMPDLPFDLSPPADLHRARFDATDLWDEAMAEVCDAISKGASEVFGRLGSPTDAYRELDRDLIENLLLERGSNNGSINGQSVYSLRVRQRPKRSRPPTERERVISAIRDLWPEITDIPSNKAIDRELRNNGVAVSESTIKRALTAIRSGRT